MRWRTVPALTFSASAGTSGGGGGGGVHKSSESTHSPRRTGEVRVAIEVIVKMLAWVSNPPRWLFGFTGTRTSADPEGPVTP